MTTSSLPAEIRGLPVADRLDLVERIWDSIVEDRVGFEPTEAQRSELDRRIAAHDADPDRGSSWDEVKQQLVEG